MKVSPVGLGAVALLVALTTHGGARADPIPWIYSWSNSPGQLNANSPGTGYLTLANETAKQAAGNSDIVATNIRAFSTATTDKPDVFTAKAYSLQLTLTDANSLKSATLVFTGHLDGTLTAGNSNITNTFTGQTSYTVVLGQNQYAITISSYTPPGPTGVANSGAIGAHANVTVEALSLPEPGALTLFALGATALVVPRLYRRRRRRQPLSQ
jgi:hypothetical protein